MPVPVQEVTGPDQAQYCYQVHYSYANLRSNSEEVNIPDTVKDTQRSEVRRLKAMQTTAQGKMI